MLKVVYITIRLICCCCCHFSLDFISNISFPALICHHYVSFLLRCAGNVSPRIWKRRWFERSHRLHHLSFGEFVLTILIDTYNPFIVTGFLPKLTVNLEISDSNWTMLDNSYVKFERCIFFMIVSLGLVMTKNLLYCLCCRTFALPCIV